MKYCKWLLPILVLTAVVLQSCNGVVGGKSDENPLDFFKGPILLEGILEVGEKEYGVRLESEAAPNGKVSFTAPESMNGYVFEKADDGFFVSYGDLRIPFRQSTMPGGAGLLLNLLEYVPVKVQKSTEKANGIEMSVYTMESDGQGILKLYLKNSDHTPLRIEFAGQDLNAVFHVQKIG